MQVSFFEPAPDEASPGAGSHDPHRNAHDAFAPAQAIGMSAGREFHIVE
jgi:hypothetical protein